MASPLVRTFRLTRRSGSRAATDADDAVAVEEPLEIRVDGRTLAVVMRTPGHDVELVRGMLLGEGIVRGADEIAGIHHCRELPAHTDRSARDNVILVQRRGGPPLRAARFRRQLVASSACGVCGKLSIDQLARRTPPVTSDLVVTAACIAELPALLHARQEAFAETGGLHAAALFVVQRNRPKLLVLREDVGRHNAVDKVIGAALHAGLLPLSRVLLFVSGRVSFEIIQKARVAGIPIVAAVSAPTSLAIDLAAAGNQTLIAFVRGDRLNVYCGPERLQAGAATAAAPIASAPTAAAAVRARRARPPRRPA